MQQGVRKRPDTATFWLGWAYGAGLAGSLAYAAVVFFFAPTPLFPQATVTALFTWVFQGVLVFFALAFVLSMLSAPRAENPPSSPPPSPSLRFLHPHDAEFLEVLWSRGIWVPAIAVPAIGGGSTRGGRGQLSGSLRRALAFVLPLAAFLLILSLLQVIGSPGVLAGRVSLENARMVFGLLGLFVLLVPGLAYVFAAAFRSRTGR